MDAPWISPMDELPYRAELVAIRVRGKVRRACYRIEDRWYAMIDLDRWQMNTSPYWPDDQSWYLRTEQIEAWKLEETLAGQDREEGAR